MRESDILEPFRRTVPVQTVLLPMAGTASAAILTAEPRPARRSLHRRSGDRCITPLATIPWPARDGGVGRVLRAAPERATI
jgi:hypothetical protein